MIAAELFPAFMIIIGAIDVTYDAVKYFFTVFIVQKHWIEIKCEVQQYALALLHEYRIIGLKQLFDVPEDILQDRLLKHIRKL